MSLVLVDTSVWINLLGPTPNQLLSAESLYQIATCPPIIQEVLQGVKDDLIYKKISASFLAFPCFDQNLPKERYLEAAMIYRSGRKRGLTIRSSVDCLIAAVAVAHGLPIWHRDRDFSTLAKYLDLKLVNGV
jgi:predicted nucleic acid-binding protein